MPEYIIKSYSRIPSDIWAHIILLIIGSGAQYIMEPPGSKTLTLADSKRIADECVKPGLAVLYSIMKLGEHSNMFVGTTHMYMWQNLIVKQWWPLTLMGRELCFWTSPAKDEPTAIRNAMADRGFLVGIISGINKSFCRKCYNPLYGTERALYGYSLQLFCECCIQKKIKGKVRLLFIKQI